MNVISSRCIKRYFTSSHLLFAIIRILQIYKKYCLIRDNFLTAAQYIYNETYQTGLGRIPNAETCSSYLKPLDFVSHSETHRNSQRFLKGLARYKNRKTYANAYHTRYTEDTRTLSKNTFKRWREKWHLTGCGGEGRRIKASIDVGIRKVRRERANNAREERRKRKRSR